MASKNKRLTTNINLDNSFHAFHKYIKPNNIQKTSKPISINPERQPIVYLLTVKIQETFLHVNSHFKFTKEQNPRRVLTKKTDPADNGYDNTSANLIVYVNDIFHSDSKNHNSFRVVDILGTGTFGQVFKCFDQNNKKYFAVKVIKNKPAYFNQALIEVRILKLLNKQCDPHNVHHIVRLFDYFLYKQHLCLVFELLNANLYELIKQNKFHGLSFTLIRTFCKQILDVLAILQDAKIIHCDLKPENILLKNITSAHIKVIDFGSACFESQSIYSYIQSRFYRAPEIILGLPYTTSIDVWSLGCIAAELFLGLPIYPGVSEHNQISRIVEMQGYPPLYMLEKGRSVKNYFNTVADPFKANKYRYVIKSSEEYYKEKRKQPIPSKRYFNANNIHELIMKYPYHKKITIEQRTKEEFIRRSFVDFLLGLLNLDPNLRWTPKQCMLHPFITGEKFQEPFKPPPDSHLKVDRSGKQFSILYQPQQERHERNRSNSDIQSNNTSTSINSDLNNITLKT